MPHANTSPKRDSTVRTPASPLPTAERASRYLTPTTQQRILSWRHHASPPIPTPASKTKSAPASLSLSKAPSSSTCACGGKSSCVCSRNSSRPGNPNHKSYYSNTKKSKDKTSTLASTAPPLTNALTMSNTAPPRTPTTPITPSMPITPIQPDPKGYPPTQQMMPHQMASGLPQQYGQAATVPLADPGLTVPPLKPGAPRVAGGRDPITQN